eukprot:TRINITY_DN1227_c0_g2_i1.p1 TRINITY_DN1227_c0_g2~~TRINITY_DN1227_c0_g2_i1.p1  ORF type:complete len:177 (+),score=39.01 TRINITY_DN1227_c0_g2_i1:72-533(+)
MTKWDEKYVMAVVALPMYFVLTMAPHFARLPVMARFMGGLKEANVEPRKAFEELANSDDSKAAFVRRCTGAHMNSWENYIVFISALVAAVAGGVKPSFVNDCSLIIILARLCYIVCYLSFGQGILSTIRSFFYIVGHGTCFALWVKASMEICD